ncbi:MAG: DivIVA domain-containing protein [Candidatus Nanopelagicales bacterium]
MAMTPADVHAQQFTTVRMRTGYDMDEVDAFLDVVETEISRLLGENDDLRAQLTQAQSRVLAAEQRSARAESTSGESAKPPVVTTTAVEVIEKPDAPPADNLPTAGGSVVADESASGLDLSSPAPQFVRSQDAAQVSTQALAMLEIAQRTAEETVSVAKSEAGEIMSKARAEARAVTADLDEQRRALEEQVGQLRTFERNYRVTLRDHIATQLAQFDAAARSEDLVADAGPEALATAAVQEALPD